MKRPSPRPLDRSCLWFVLALSSTTCLIMADHNRYSVDARAAGRMVLVRSHAERIVVLLGDEVVADHPRHFRREQIIYDPWHYLPVLMKKPGALRNGCARSSAATRLSSSTRGEFSPRRSLATGSRFEVLTEIIEKGSQPAEAGAPLDPAVVRGTARARI